MNNKSLKELKKEFEANMLDGDKLEDCGGSMLSAKSVFEYLSSALKEQEDRFEEIKTTAEIREFEKGVRVGSEKLKEQRKSIIKKVGGVSEHSTRGYFDSCDDWIDGYREGKIDMRTDILKVLKEEGKC